MIELSRGVVARCSLGTLGLITCDSPTEVTYNDGRVGTAWTGVHLTNDIAPIGSPWSSRDPEPVFHISDVLNE